MNGLGKPFRKKPIQKIEKTVKIKVKLPHVNKKPLARKQIFVKFRAKNFHAVKPLAFSLHFLFRRDQNHYSKITTPKWQKSWKSLNSSLKKDSAPIQFKFFEL